MPRNPRSAAPDAPASLLANLGTIRAPKSARVFVLAQYPDMFTGADGKQYPHPNAGAEIMPRTPTTDGRLASVECEIRADGSTGAPLYAITRVSDDGRESTIRASFADLAAFAGAAKAHGLDLA
jgi:hypothetical protein